MIPTACNYFTTKLRIGLLTVSLCLLGVGSANANPILGGQLYANGGDVTVTFLGSDAGYDNLLYLALSADGVLFEGHVSANGATKDLGNFDAGTELVFLLNNQQGDWWSTGSASRNSDGQMHALVDGNYLPGQTWVGFEDLPGGGDRDYNDLIFSVQNVHVPDAGATLPLLGLAVLGLLGFARRSRQ